MNNFYVATKFVVEPIEWIVLGSIDEGVAPSADEWDFRVVRTYLSVEEYCVQLKQRLITCDTLAQAIDVQYDGERTKRMWDVLLVSDKTPVPSNSETLVGKEHPLASKVQMALKGSPRFLGAAVKYTKKQFGTRNITGAQLLHASIEFYKRASERTLLEELLSE